MAGKDTVTAYEVNELDFRKCWWRRGKLHIKWLSTFGAIILPISLLGSVVVWGLNLREVGAVLIAEPILIGIALLKGREFANLNRFGVFIDGIAPPRKPKAYRGLKGPIVVPYASIDHLEYKQVGSGLFPNSHYGVVLHMVNGEEFEFDATEIYAETRWKEEEVARAQIVLEELARQFNSWRAEKRKEAFRLKPHRI